MAVGGNRALCGHCVHILWPEPTPCSQENHNYPMQVQSQPQEPEAVWLWGQPCTVWALCAHFMARTHTLQPRKP